MTRKRYLQSVILLSALLFLNSTGAAQTIYYVDDDAALGGDGTSWATAFRFLQDALAVATVGDEIRVAQGAYQPDRDSANPDGSGDRYATFQLISGVTLSGGYRGVSGGGDPDDRDIITFETSLSGDIGTPDDNSDNCYHVTTGSGTDETAVLDGFTITAGNADGSSEPHCFGGGMYTSSGSPTLTNCTFSGNTVYGARPRGGGMYTVTGSPTLTDCTFTGNSANSTSHHAYGGGMCNAGGSPTLTNCTFSGNSAGGVYGGGTGGGMYNASASPTLTECTFSGNSTQGEGGGMYSEGSGNVTLIDCTFSGNSAVSGAGMSNFELTNATLIGCTFHGNSTEGTVMYNDETNVTLIDCAFTGNWQYAFWCDGLVQKNATLVDCTFNENGLGLLNRCGNLTLANCTFSGNSYGGLQDDAGNSTLTNCTFSGNSGGGMENYGGGNPTLTNCTFSGNSGSGMYNYWSNPTLTNCTFSGNSGSGIHQYAVGDPNSLILANCTFSQNAAPDGSAISFDSDQFPGMSTLVAANCIFRDGGDEMRNSNGSTITIIYSDVQGGTGEPWFGTGCIDEDPLFIDAHGPDDIPGTEDDDLRLSAGSPCIDAADNTAVPPGTTTDLDGNPRFVDDLGTPDTGNGTPPIVDMGAYEFQGMTPPPSRLFVDADATGGNNGTSWEDAFSDLQDALDIAASFPGIVDEIWVAEGTYTPARGGTDRTATFQLISGVEVYGGFVGDETQLIQRDPQAHITILSGDLAGDDGPNFTNNGDNSYHVVTGTDTDQTAILDGFVITGGNANGSPWPWVDDRGGGMQNYIDGHPMLVNCTFTGNYAANGGAGMDNEYDCSPTLVNCVFADNWSSVHSAGLLDAYDCSPALTNCLFMGNSADGFGAGMINADYCDPVLVNCTFSENTAGDFTGGIYSTHDSAPTLANCILWNNADAAGTDEIAQIYTDNGLVSINYCCIKGWTGALGGDGNIGEDPLLVDPGNDDFSIAAGSPCIDAADNTAVPADIADLDGDGDRSERTPRDLGGDPRFLDDPDTDDSGVPAAEYPHVVDMGAYEFIPARVIYVDSRAPYGGDGWSWSTAFNDLQEALSISRSVDEIWVAEGTYKPGASRADAFAMKNGLGMYGGFAGTETARDQRDPATYQTILSGDIGAQGDTSDNCYHVFDHPDGTNLDGTAVLDGFTITGGNGNEGGGMYNYSSSPTVRDCTFTSNLADYGGGIHNYSSAPTIADCSFSDNSAREVGGGICNWSFSSPTVTNCAFLHNSAIGPSGGGGIHNSDSSPTVTNCMFMGNSLSGIGNHGSSSAAVTNCIFTSNSLSGISNYDSSSPTVANCTFAGNSLYGMSSYDSSSPTAANCIFWWDTPGEISGPAPVVEYCNVQGGWPGTGNIAAPPLLADPDGPDGIPGTADDDLRLLPNSPCIDAASNLWVPADVTDLDADGDTTERIPFDLDGDPRFVDEPWIPDLGVDDSPAYRNVADMGAYEFEPCHGDINTDGFRNTTDFMLFISAYGSYDDDPNYIPRADLWPDGHINTIDFMIFSQFYGQACP